MPVPVLMTHGEWMRRTNVAKVIGKGDKTRSADLLVIDGLLQSYTNDPKPNDLETLDVVLGSWMQGKTKNGQLNTIREHDSAVSDLRRQVDAAVQLRSPLAVTTLPRIFIGDDVYRGKHWVPDDFSGVVQTALQQIASARIGAGLLDAISKACLADPDKKVVIEYSGGGSSAAPLDVVTNEIRHEVQPTVSSSLNPQALLSNPRLVATARGVTEDGLRRTFVNAEGTSAVVTWNHNDKGQDGRPAFIALAHELIHVLHYVQGSCYRAATGFVQDNQNSGIMEEEMRTVGLLKYASETPSENAIRGEHRVTLRTTYMPNVSFDNVVATALV
jgi:hypothetical protein